MSSTSVTAKKLPKVELHVHLDGAIRASTVWDLAKKKGIQVPGESAADLQAHLKVSPEDHGNLEQFLAQFSIFMPTVVGDPEAIQRVAYEWCEYAAQENIVYSEVRFCPHLLASAVEKPLHGQPELVTPRQVMDLVTSSVEKGCRDFRTKVRLLLCCMRGSPEWSQEMLQFCTDYKQHGVVGIDLAGSEGDAALTPTAAEHTQAFQKAAKQTIGRTVHAGENGPAANVREAVDVMHAQRIGHGYHTLEDPALYKRLLKEKMHFEICPTSSIVTDDPLLTGRLLNQEYEFLVDEVGMAWKDILQANINAAKSCFLPVDEKKELIKTLMDAYKAQLPAAFDSIHVDE